MRHLAWILLLCLLGAMSAFAADRAATDPILFRVRVLRLTPAQAVRIHWRHGGEGLSGKPTVGELTAVRPEAPAIAADPSLVEEAQIDISLAEDEDPDDRIIRKGSVYDYHYLFPGVWTRYQSLAEFGRRPSFVTFTITGYKTGKRLTN